MTSEDHDDIHRVIALCFRGHNSMSDLDLERILSFDMEWLSPEEAEIAVNLSLIHISEPTRPS